MSSLRLPSDISSRLNPLCRTGYALALLICAGLAALPSDAQVLDLGQPGTTLSGTATVTSLGTMASGTYQYYNHNGTPAPLDAAETYYSGLNTYDTSTANVKGGSIGELTTFDTSTANVTGGTMVFLVTSEFSTANVSGGNIDELETYYFTKTNVKGGSIGELYT